MRASHIVLSQANGQRAKLGHHDRITRVEITINRSKQRIVADLAADEMQPTVIALPRVTRVTRITITVVDRVPGKERKGLCGFAEVALEMR